MNRLKNDGIRAIPRSVLWSTLVRVLLLLGFVISVTLAWYGVNRLPPVELLLREKDSERAGLANELQQLEKRWKAEDARSTEVRFQEAGGRLFTGPNEWDGWLQQVRDRGAALAFETTVQIGTRQPHPLTQSRLSRHRVTIDLQPIAAAGPGVSPYERLLSFVNFLENGKRRVDVLELSAVGGSQSVRSARIVVELWSQEPN